MLTGTLMECPDNEFQIGFVLDQSDVAVAEREWLMQELAQLSGSEVELMRLEKKLMI